MPRQGAELRLVAAQAVPAIPSSIRTRRGQSLSSLPLLCAHVARSRHAAHVPHNREDKGYSDRGRGETQLVPIRPISQGAGGPGERSFDFKGMGASGR